MSSAGFRRRSGRRPKERLDKTKNRKYRPSEKQKPDPAVARADMRLASRFYQLKTGHCLTGQYLVWITTAFGGASIRSRLASICSRTARNGNPTNDPLDDRLGRD